MLFDCRLKKNAKFVHLLCSHKHDERALSVFQARRSEISLQRTTLKRLIETRWSGHLAAVRVSDPRKNYVNFELGLSPQPQNYGYVAAVYAMIA